MSRLHHVTEEFVSRGRQIAFGCVQLEALVDFPWVDICVVGCFVRENHQKWRSDLGVIYVNMSPRKRPD